MCGILAQRFDQDFVFAGIDHFHLLVAQGDQLANNANREWLVCFGNDQFAIHDVLERHFMAQLMLIEFIVEFECFRRIKLIDDFTVGRVAQSTQEGGSEEFTTATTAIKINVKQVVCIELHFQP